LFRSVALNPARIAQSTVPVHVGARPDVDNGRSHPAIQIHFSVRGSELGRKGGGSRLLRRNASRNGAGSARLSRISKRVFG
jgi:hypothetical protein